jgi:hypothetical protein
LKAKASNSIPAQDSRDSPLQHDPNQPEDVLKVDADEDGVGGDDAADCLKYLVATKTRSVLTRKLREL